MLVSDGRRQNLLAGKSVSTILMAITWQFSSRLNMGYTVMYVFAELHIISVKKFEDDAFVEMLFGGLNPNNAAIEKVLQIMDNIMRVCNAAMPRILVNRQSSYWWNEEITEFRAACFRTRRTRSCARNGSIPELSG